MIQFFILLIALGVLWYLRDRSRYAKYPPGPGRLPIIGSLLHLKPSDNLVTALENLSEYGPVVHVKMGLVDTIAFLGYSTVRDILLHEKTQMRTFKIIGAIRERNKNRNLGFGFSYGSTAETLRHFTVRSLRNFGFGKPPFMNKLINEEYAKFQEHLRYRLASCNQIVSGDNLFDLTQNNMTWRLITGANYDLEHPEMIKLLGVSHKMFEAGGAADKTVAFPFLWDLFPQYSGKTLVAEACDEMRSFMMDTITDHRRRAVYKEDPQCFVDVFLAKMDETRNEPDHKLHFDDEQLTLSMMDVLQGSGSETISHSLGYAVMYMLLHPTIQDKVRAEIDSEIGEEDVTLESRPRLPFTHATVLECFRWSSIAPFPPMRASTEDFYFRGHLIPKGTWLLINIHSANFCKDKWTDPENYRPERWLTEDGHVDGQLAASMVTFGGGRKVCIGNKFAEDAMFIYFASLLRDFTIEKVAGEPEPNTEPLAGITNKPLPFKVRLVPRK